MAEERSLAAIITFLEEIGLEVIERAMTRETLVPGIDIDRGALVVDPQSMCRPADLLHEGAHIALTSPAERASLDGTISSTPAQEVAAIAWTWAAATHLELDPADVFHEEVISGNGPTLLENFTEGHYVGVPMLQYWGLTFEPKQAVLRGLDPYPRMQRWVRT